MPRQVVNFGDRRTQAGLRWNVGLAVAWVLGHLAGLAHDCWLPLWRGAGVAEPSRHLWYGGFAVTVYLTLGCFVSAGLWSAKRHELAPASPSERRLLRVWCCALVAGVATAALHAPACEACHAHAMRLLVSRTAGAIEALSRRRQPTGNWEVVRLGAALNSRLPALAALNARLVIEPKPTLRDGPVAWRLAYGTDRGWLEYVPGHRGDELGGWRRGRKPSPFGRPEGGE